jgi:hypothetical protein
VYDQSFIIELENGLRFLTNFKYALVPEVSKDPVHDSFSKLVDLKTGDYNKFISLCDQTMIGFVQTMPSIVNKSYSMTEHQMQCFYAKQKTHYDMEKTVSVKTESETVKVAVITSQNKIITTAAAQ